MKTLYYLFALLLCPVLATGQAEAPVTFTVETSSDTLLMGHRLRVSFTLANAGGQDFQPPPFENFDLVSGPRIASQMSVSNNIVQQTISYTYILQPRDIGSWWIGSASIAAEGDVLETEMVEVQVFPNPDGIEQDPAQLGQAAPLEMPGFHVPGFDLDGLDFPDFDLWNFSFPELDSFPLFSAPDSLSRPKRRVYKL